MVHLPHFALSVSFGLFTVVVCAEPNRPLPPAATKTIDYARDVESILQARCLECHGPDQQESGLRVDRRDSLVRGGDLGQPEAPRDALICRTYLDMLGLLPTPDEVAAFTADDRPMPTSGSGSVRWTSRSCES